MTNDPGAVAGSAWPPGPAGRGLRPRQWWSVITTLLLAAVFFEAVFAGAMLSGVGWARTAHATSAVVLAASTLAGGVIAFITLRRTPGGSRLAWILLSMTVVILTQAALGVLSAKGANLLWAHVPLGVALVGVAGQAVASARKLGGR